MVKLDIVIFLFQIVKFAVFRPLAVIRALAGLTLNKLFLFKNGPTPASFKFIFVLSKTRYTVTGHPQRFCLGKIFAKICIIEVATM